MLYLSDGGAMSFVDAASKHRVRDIRVEPGRLVVWDNDSLLHAVCPADATAPRFMLGAAPSCSRALARPRAGCVCLCVRLCVLVSTVTKATRIRPNVGQFHGCPSCRGWRRLWRWRGRGWLRGRRVWCHWWWVWWWWERRQFNQPRLQVCPAVNSVAVTAAAFDASATARGLTDSSQCFVSRKDILVKNIIITARGLMARGEAGSVVTVVRAASF